MTAVKHKKVHERVVMARKGRRFSGKRLQPSLPEAKDEPVIPKYFNMIRGSGYDKAEGERREILPGPMPQSDEIPRPMRGRRVLEQQTPFPGPAPEPEQMPLLIRVARYFAAILGVEPERPVAMPVVPELSYPALYTRFPVMKTVTKMTDAAGEISVPYAQSYATVPGVVITVKDPDNVFGTVFSTTLTGFEVRLFKIDHNHGGVVDDGGIHTPTINPDGYHKHQVTGSISWDEEGNYGRLVMANYTNYETAHVHTQVQTQLESAHKHHVYPTTSAGAHTHPIPATDGPDDTATALIAVTAWGAYCDPGWCIEAFYNDSFAQSSHYHLNSGKVTGSDGAHAHPNIETGAGDAHRHILNSTGAAPSPGHRHLISNDALYDHYITHIDISADLWTSDYESPYHDHSGEQIVAHKHDVPADGRVLLKNTSVTITYIAQEESS